MNIFSKLRQEQLVSRFNTETETANNKLAKKLAVNKTSRQKNLADFVADADAINQVISGISVLDGGLTPSFTLETDETNIAGRTSNKSAVVFSTMFYVNDDRRISPDEAEAIYAALEPLGYKVEVEPFNRKVYLYIVFDKHEYQEPKPLELDTYGAITEYYNRVLKPTEDTEPLGKTDIAQAWNEAISWYIEKQKNNA